MSLKKPYKLFRRSQRKVFKILEQIENIQSLPYYDIFRRQGERERDMNHCYEVMRDTLNEQQAHLENIIIEANKELNKVSQNQKTFTLLKNQLKQS